MADREPADPLSVQCPSCLAPPEQACRTEHGTHADRQDSADLHAVEHGACALCGHFMVRGVPTVSTEVTAWHPDPADAAVCPPLPDPKADWDAYALALQQGLAPGYPGPEHFVPKDAIAHAASINTNPVALAPPPVDPPNAICPDCLAGKHRNCTGQAWDHVADEPAPCTCTDEEHHRG